MWNTVSKGASAVEPAVKQYLPPCQEQCPINEDIQRTNVLISLLPKDPAKAAPGILQIGDYLYEKNPFFAVCGYVCGLCELECNYHAKGGAIKRRLLKRFISDTYIPYLETRDEWSLIKHKENVAIVGGGPAGLMAGYELSRRGYRVTIFEASDRLGGALWLIPRYRLPERVLMSTLEGLVRMVGMDVKYNTRIGQGKWTLDRLQNEGFKAVFIAQGTPTPRTLTFGGEQVEGQDLSGVMYGHTFLYEVSHGNIRPDYFKGKKILVIGGGNVAFDVARTARRLGGETTVVALECEDKTSHNGIPADVEEIRGAWEEGIRIVYSRGVQRIIGEGERMKRIECPKCLRVYDEKGFDPKFDPEDTMVLDGDVLIVTVGQGPDWTALQREGLVDEHGRLAVDPLTLQSRNKDWVFVGGDLLKIGFMVEAMQDGLTAAESIERHLQDRDMTEGRKRLFEVQDIPLRRHYLSEPEVVWIPPEKRMHFQLFERGFTLKEAIEEAHRCLACGPCIACKACVSIGLREFLNPVEVLTDRCCGCGICVSACFYSAIQLKDVEMGRISITDPFKCKSCGMCVSACPSDARELKDDPLEGMLQTTYGRLS
ncbi:MAG: FAD-dependent oxidoreductase [Deltaproteobacteria bacterium]|nr:FAD-dependent oxidoreductase [Deltaproteobacteria bacterium]